jgi:hypothetical protein|tara:strand:- start:2438 stop:3388 length:951 start_codon:yes stop_codon:yes gene_type:complete
MNTDSGQVTQGDITIDSNHETAGEIQLAFDDSINSPADTEGSSPSPDTGEEVAPQASQAESTEEESKESKSKANRRNNPTEAVKSAVAKQREAERRAEAAEARIHQMTTAPPAPPDPEPQRPDWERYKTIPGVPTVDQFRSYEDYSMAMASFISDVRYQERDAQKSSAEEAQRQQDRDSSQISKWNDRLTKARSENPEFDDSLNLDTPMSLPMQHLAMESPQGVEILQWLSANPKESQRISTLHPAETYREMGKIEARLEAAPPRASARAVSNAKPPIRPLGTSPHVADDFAITDDLSFDEHFRRANAEDRARGRL